MARRPIFQPDPHGPPYVREVPVQFTWHAGMSAMQKHRSITSLQDAARQMGIHPVLEVSTKSQDPFGRGLSAFNLSLTTSSGIAVSVEAAYQGGKVFARGGPFKDLYSVPPRAAKRDSRLKASGSLLAFDFEGVTWPLEPQTAFYDWLYITALRQNPSLSSYLSGFAAFADIEFNPTKAVGCQARSAALYVALSTAEKLEASMLSRDTFLHVVYPVTPDSPSAQRLLF